MRQAVRSSLDQAFVDAFQLTMFVATGLALAGAVLSLVVIPGPARREPVQVVAEPPTASP